jgi:hypothetical protein
LRRMVRQARNHPRCGAKTPAPRPCHRRHHSPSPLAPDPPGPAPAFTPHSRPIPRRLAAHQLTLHFAAPWGAKSSMPAQGRSTF